MRNFKRIETFDLAINLYSSFGYFDHDEDNIRVLENVHSSLREGGCLILDMQGKESLARRFEEVRLHRYADGALLFDHPEIEEEWKRVRGRWTFVRNDEVRRFAFSVRLYSGEEIKAALNRAGFSETHIYGDLAGNPYGLRAERLVALGVK
jgi:SAM-dependent methyltransferase